MRSSEKMQLKRKVKRVFLFLGIVFIPAFVVCVLLLNAKVPQWLNILVLVLVLFILFGIFSFVCFKIDNHKEKRLKDKSDPFSD